MVTSKPAFAPTAEASARSLTAKRDVERFPADFMYRLSAHEWNHLGCQIGISSSCGCPYIDALESRCDEQFSAVFDAIKNPITDDNLRKSKRPIGFL